MYKIPQLFVEFYVVLWYAEYSNIGGVCPAVGELPV